MAGWLASQLQKLAEEEPGYLEDGWLDKWTAEWLLTQLQELARRGLNGLLDSCLPDLVAIRSGQLPELYVRQYCECIVSARQEERKKDVDRQTNRQRVGKGETNTDLERKRRREMERHHGPKI